MNRPSLYLRSYIPKKYPDTYGKYMDCASCREGGLRESDDSKLVFKHIADEDDEKVYLECPECGAGGIFSKPVTREFRLVVTG